MVTGLLKVVSNYAIGVSTDYPSSSRTLFSMSPVPGDFLAEEATQPVIRSLFQL